MPVDASKLSRSQRIGYFTSNLVIRGMLGAVLLLPYTWRVPFMGWLFSRVLGPISGAQKRIRRNLSITFPDMPEAEIKELCHSVPDNVGRTLIEMYSGDKFIERANAEPPHGPGFAALEEARAEGRPVFLVTGHFGNYNAVRGNLNPKGYKAGALYRRMANPYFNEHYVRSMQDTGELMFEQGPRGMRELVKHLKSGGIVGILHDLHVHGGTELTYFGQPAVTSLGTAELALKYNAVVIPCYAIRQPNGLDFRIQMNTPIPHTDAMTMSQALNDDLEQVVREHMGQWFWIHRRWKQWEGLGHPGG